MLSKKAKYGLKALIYLADHGSEGAVPIVRIAEDESIPKKFLDAILLELRNRGILSSRKGRGGGYSLARPTTDISIGEVIRTLDGPLAPILCASRTAYQACTDCSDPDDCAIRATMVDIRNAIAEVLDNTSLADMLAKRATGEGKRLFFDI